MKLPGGEEIAAKAAALGLVDEHGNMPAGARSRVVKAILAERKAAKPAPQNLETLARTVTKVDGGHIVVEVVFVPDQKEPRA